MRINRRQFGAISTGMCGAALAGGLRGSPAEANVGGAALQQKVKATIEFKGLVVLVATSDWKKAHVLLVDTTRVCQTLPFHLPTLVVPKSAISGQPPAPDDATSSEWIWHLWKRRVTFEGTSANGTKGVVVDDKCPMTPQKWRDPRFIADARRVLNDQMKGNGEPLHVTNDPIKFPELQQSRVASQIVLPAGTIAAREPSRAVLNNAEFHYPSTGGKQPITDSFEHAIEECDALTVVLTPLLGGPEIRIKLNPGTVPLQILNRVPHGAHPPGAHFVALFELVQNKPNPGQSDAFKCESTEKIPPEEYNEGPDPDDPIYCPPLRVYHP